MKKLTSLAVIALAFGLIPTPSAAQGDSTVSPIALVIHGGAGALKKEISSPELEAQYRDKLLEALRIGFTILEEGGSSLDAVEETIRFLEDSPLFNAGKGAVFTAEGKNELDASIMDGATRRAGAVAGVTTIRNPITAARTVMEKTQHVLLAGAGAELFARETGLEQVEPDYFFTERRWEQLEKRKRREQPTEPPTAPRGEAAVPSVGTVGAVALDREGHLAAGTSTGGMTYKKHGRVGDSPIIGAGTWADERCGVSATGHGEFFIRYAVASDICARMRYLGLSIEQAAEEVIMKIMKTLVEAGGDGGIIALDSEGKPALVFNSSGMYRGYLREGGKPYVAIYRGE
jgi:beta-aspartyl-peptidase (threonine type)